MIIEIIIVIFIVANTFFLYCQFKINDFPSDLLQLWLFAMFKFVGGVKGHSKASWYQLLKLESPGPLYPTVHND